jgi:hypothetical protein
MEKEMSENDEQECVSPGQVSDTVVCVMVDGEQPISCRK